MLTVIPDEPHQLFIQCLVVGNVESPDGSWEPIGASAGLWARHDIAWVLRRSPRSTFQSRFFSRDAVIGTCIHLIVAFLM